MTEPRETEASDARWDGTARFLQELRELRSRAGLGQAELAARAHYPCDVIRAAEAGPALPGLPVLSAYVRGCGGTFAEWEERWRSVTGSPASPVLPTRTAGYSEAADAGARIGATSTAADSHDPALVMAALGRVADGMAAAVSSSPPPRSPAGAAGALISDAAVSPATAAAWAVQDLAASAQQPGYPAPATAAWGYGAADYGAANSTTADYGAADYGAADYGAANSVPAGPTAYTAGPAAYTAAPAAPVDAPRAAEPAAPVPAGTRGAAAWPAATGPVPARHPRRAVTPRMVLVALAAVVLLVAVVVLLA